MSRQKYTYQDHVTALQSFLKGLAGEHSSLPKLIFLWGPSDFLLQRAAAAIKHAWLALPESQFQSLDSKEVLEPDDFRGLWQQSSMFDPAPFYWIRQLESAKKLWKNFSLIPAKRTLTNPLAGSYLGEKLAAPLQKEAQRLGAYQIPCFPPAYKELSRFVQSLLREQGLSLHHDAIALLQEAAGEDLFKLDNEIKKLGLIFTGDKRQLQADDISPYLGVMKQEHAFRLTQLLLQAKYAQAHILCIDLIKRGESAIALLGILTRHIRNSLILAEACKRPSASSQAASSLRLPYSVIKSYNQYVTTIKAPRLSATLAVCQRADMELKSSSKLSDELVLAKVLEEIAALKR